MEDYCGDGKWGAVSDPVSGIQAGFGAHWNQVLRRPLNTLASLSSYLLQISQLLLLLKFLIVGIMAAS